MNPIVFVYLLPKVGHDGVDLLNKLTYYDPRRCLGRTLSRKRGFQTFEASFRT